MAPIVAIEGIPGAGKTCVAKALAVALEPKGRIALVSEIAHGALPQTLVKQFLTEIDSLPIGDNRRAYLLMNLQAYKWREAVRLSQSCSYDMILTDRSWWSMEVDRRVFNVSESILQRLSQGIRRKRPDLTIYLRTSVKEARQRKQAAGSRGRIFAYTEYVEEMVSVYEGLAQRHQWCIIDVDGMEVEGIVALCVSECNPFFTRNHLVSV